MADQGANPPLAKLLGYDEDARLLIVNADDAGMCHAVNSSLVEVFGAGIVKSTTVMACAPWFREFVEIVRDVPEIHYGIHLTATSEWDTLRWGPIAGRERVPSLLDADGYFYRSEHDFFRHAKPEHVAIEFRAQIEFALAAGLTPTHLDAHMGAYHWDERFFRLAKAMAAEHGLTMRIGFAPRRDLLRAEGWAVADKLVWETYDVPVADRELFYKECIRRVAPGVTEMLCHPARPSDELRAICEQTADYRTFDFRFFTDPKTKAFLDDEGIVCIGFDQLQALQQKTSVIAP
jgi:predicted glycoside hydrolase/deacetylase ChbG (UPF0249 family)